MDSTKPLTDKEIYEAVTNKSVECPNCGGGLVLCVNHARLTSAQLDALAGMVAMHAYVLRGVEAASAAVVSKRDGSGFDNQRFRKFAALGRGDT